MAVEPVDVVDDPTLPDRDLRRHVLATACRAAEACLMEHGYDQPDRSLEILDIAMDEAWDDSDDGPVH